MNNGEGTLKPDRKTLKTIQSKKTNKHISEF